MNLVNKILLEYKNSLDNTDIEIRYISWLFFLYYIYHNNMKITNWIKDRRMGVSFIEAMKFFEEKGIVEINSEFVYVKNKIKAENLIDSIFKSETIEEAIDKSEGLEYLDTKDYSISGIPIELYKRKTSKGNFTNITLSPEDYKKLINWYKKYQRSAQGWYTALNKYAGKVGELLGFENYILYRGVYLKNKQVDLEEGDFILDTRMSWTKDPRMAESFAKGSTNYSMSPKFKSGIDTAIILKHHFNADELLLDIEFVEETNKYFKDIVDFGLEEEVVIIPKKRKYKIWKIFK